MIMWLKKILLITLLIVIFQQVIQVQVIGAQESARKDVVIKSDPPGAMLYFQGENSFVGVTPFKVKPNLMGKYKITAVKSGYEKSKLEYYFKGTEKGTLRLRLTEKTRFKAGVRSLVFPGWGQMYSERNKSGLLLSIIQVGAGIYTLVSHQNYEKAFDDYQNAIDNYKQNKKYSAERDQYWNIVVRRHQKASDAFNKRQTWLYISGGLWLYNLLDAVLFFPSYDKGIFSRTLPGISANFQNDTVGLTYTLPF